MVPSSTKHLFVSLDVSRAASNAYERTLFSLLWRGTNNQPTFKKISRKGNSCPANRFCDISNIFVYFENIQVKKTENVHAQPHKVPCGECPQHVRHHGHHHHVHHLCCVQHPSPLEHRDERDVRKFTSTSTGPHRNRHLICHHPLLHSCSIYPELCSEVSASLLTNKCKQIFYILENLHWRRWKDVFWIFLS